MTQLPRIFTKLTILGVALILAALPAASDTFTVNTNSDLGAGSLRSAISAANANPGADTINVQAVGTIRPTFALPALSDTSGGTTITSTGGSIVDGSGGTPLPTAASGAISAIAPISGAIAGSTQVTLNGTFVTSQTVGTINGATAAYAVYFGEVAEGRRADFDGSVGSFFTNSEIHVVAPAAPNGVAESVSVQFFEILQGPSMNLLGSGSYTYIDETGPLSSGLTVTSAGNVIDGLTFANWPANGVLITGAAATGNTVQNSTLGSAAKNNTGNGVEISGGASGNTVGGADSALGNVISGNGAAGVLVDGAASTGNSVLGNGITGNTGAGISLTNGANGGIAAPAIAGLVPVSGTAPASATVQIFAGTDDEGAVFVGEAVADGSGAFSVAIDLTAFNGENLTATATDAAGNTSQFSATMLIALSAPEITLNGVAQLTLECSVDVYTEAGATALDDLDGDLSSQITTEGSVDTSTPGTYTITYSVTNSTGREATATRTVTVVDSVAPAVLLNGDASILLATGEAFTDPGVTASDFCDNAVQVTTGGDVVDTDTPGIYTIIYTATDAAGNSTSVQRVVTVDGAAPELTLLGDNPLIVPCEGSYTDPGATAIDDLDGDITASIVVSGTVDVGLAGSYTVTYTVTDSVGKVSTADRTVIVEECPFECAENCPVTEDTVDNDGDGFSACVEECLGTSDSAIDTDGDGMPDPYEVENGLDPLAADGSGDLDGDFISNLDEFLAHSAANNAASPGRMVFVSVNGANAPGRGTQAEPFANIAYALNNIVVPTPASPVRIIVMPGSIVEDVAMRPWVTLEGMPGGGALVRGAFAGANNAAIKNITLTNAQAGNMAVVVLNNAAMRMENVTIGGLDAQATGILVLGGGSGAAVIEGCTFSNLSLGIDIEGSIPVIRRCVFNTPVTAGIVIRESVPVADSNPIGSLKNSRTGWNTFRVGQEGFGIINLSTQVVQMPNNDWTTQDVDYLNSVIIGPVNFVPFLLPNTARLASRLYVTLWEGGTATPVTDGMVTLEGTTLAPVEENNLGTYIFYSLPSDIYTVTGESDILDPQSVDVDLGATARKSLIVALWEDDAVKQGLFGCAAATEDASTSPRGGDLLFAGVVLFCLFAAMRLRAKRREE